MPEREPTGREIAHSNIVLITSGVTASSAALINSLDIALNVRAYEDPKRLFFPLAVVALGGTSAAIGVIREALDRRIKSGKK